LSSVGLPDFAGFAGGAGFALVGGAVDEAVEVAVAVAVDVLVAVAVGTGADSVGTGAAMVLSVVAVAVSVGAGGGGAGRTTGLGRGGGATIGVALAAGASAVVGAFASGRAAGALAEAAGVVDADPASASVNADAVGAVAAVAVAAVGMAVAMALAAAEGADAVAGVDTGSDGGPPPNSLSQNMTTPRTTAAAATKTTMNVPDPFCGAGFPVGASGAGTATAAAAAAGLPLAGVSRLSRVESDRRGALGSCPVTSAVGCGRRLAALAANALGPAGVVQSPGGVSGDFRPGAGLLVDPAGVGPAGPEKSGFVPISAIEPPASRSASSRSSAACLMTVWSSFGGMSLSEAVLGNIAGGPDAGRGGTEGAPPKGVRGPGGVDAGRGGVELVGVNDEMPRPIMVALRANPALAGFGACAPVALPVAIAPEGGPLAATPPGGAGVDRDAVALGGLLPCGEGFGGALDDGRAGGVLLAKGRSGGASSPDS
jgi:hypothetical protein